MYLKTSPSTKSVQLRVDFGARGIQRDWAINVTILPCCATHLGTFMIMVFKKKILDLILFFKYSAPDHCLQYFESSTGYVKSFNWLDVAPIDNQPRQLANQNYQVCFAADKVNFLMT